MTANSKRPVSVYDIKYLKCFRQPMTRQSDKTKKYLCYLQDVLRNIYVIYITGCFIESQIEIIFFHFITKCRY